VDADPLLVNDDAIQMMKPVRAGVELILATRPYAHDKPAKSWWAVLSTGLLMVLAVTGTLWTVHPLGKLACSIFSGLLILRFFVIYHDHQHHAILRKSWVAKVVMTIFGILSLSPGSVWRSSHNYHHKHNSRLRSAHIGSFPIMTKAQFERSSKGKRFRYLFMRHPLTILFGYVFIFLFGMCIYPFFNQPKRHFDSLIACLVHLTLAVTITYFAGWSALVLTLIIPHFVASAFGSYLFYAQHNFPDATFADNDGWTYEKAALESSSFMKLGPLMRWVTGNIGYHHLHHLNARIPFYRLPEAMSELAELQHPKTTSLHPREVLRCLRLKVWDVDAQRLVALN
jgi:omega-6 fatty acid desaturase (delta-12 desaturase)